MGRDLSAQTFRADLFANHGFVIWNNAWYGGHHTLGYSVLFPPLAAIVGVRVAGVLAAVGAAAAFAALAHQRDGRHATAASLWFAIGIGSWLMTGRLTFILGAAIALAAVLAANSGRLAIAAVLSSLCALASPVAGVFSAIVGVAVGLTGRRGAGAALAIPPGVVIVGLNLVFPTRGDQPYPFSTYFVIPLLVAVALWLVPRGQRALRVAAVLYGLFATIAFLVPNPIGSNVDRLGALVAGPIAALVLARRPLVLASLALPLLLWQLYAPIRDFRQGVADPSIEREYHGPLLAQLDRLAERDPPFRVHVPPTKNRWEAAYVAPEYPLARGWLRQLESDDFEMFTDGNLTAGAYREWLDEHGVSYVALADAELDYLAEDEAELIGNGLDFLRPVWRGEHWRLFAVRRPAGLVSGAARIEEIGPDWFELTARAPGLHLLRIRHTDLWSVVEGSACVRESDGWTELPVREPGTVRVEAELTGDACSG